MEIVTYALTVFCLSFCFRCAWRGFEWSDAPLFFGGALGTLIFGCEFWLLLTGVWK